MPRLGGGTEPGTLGAVRGCRSGWRRSDVRRGEEEARLLGGGPMVRGRLKAPDLRPQGPPSSLFLSSLVI